MADIRLELLQGTSGNDFLYGYSDSNDTINGATGEGSLDGREGNDVMIGGPGGNYVFGALPANRARNSSLCRQANVTAP